jgi:hypothetical protein
MSKWTKGEWRVLNYANDGRSLAGKVGYTDCNGETWVLFDDNHYEPNTSANIKLIAQAPVLADELSNLMDILDAILSDPEVANVQGCHCTQTDVDDAYKALQDAGYYD